MLRLVWTQHECVAQCRFYYSVNYCITTNFFSIRLFFTDTADSQDSRGKEGTIFYSILPLPTTDEHWDITTLHVRWLSRIFKRKACVYQTASQWNLPPYRITIWVIDWWCKVCLLDELTLGFCYSDLSLETSGFELASTITLVLQANQLTKCANHPKLPFLIGYIAKECKAQKMYQKPVVDNSGTLSTTTKSSSC